MYLDYNNVLSHNCLFNHIVGNRGGGKTYGALKFVLNRNFKYDEEFMYVRRYKTEVTTDKMERLFEPLQKDGLYTDIEITVKKNAFYAGERRLGHYQNLSTSKVNKSISYPYVKWIIFDEYLIDDKQSYYRYLPDEVNAFLEFYETVSRGRDVFVFFLGNKITYFNPYFMEFDLHMPYGKTYMTKNDMLLMEVADPDFINYKNATRSGKMIAKVKPDYVDYAVNNKSLRDNDDFVLPKSYSNIVCNLKIEEQLLGVWVNYADGKAWISSDHEPNAVTYTLVLDDHKPNDILLKGKRKNSHMEGLKQWFSCGQLFYDDRKAKQLFYTVLKYLF